MTFWDCLSRPRRRVVLIFNFILYTIMLFIEFIAMLFWVRLMWCRDSTLFISQVDQDIDLAVVDQGRGPEAKLRPEGPQKNFWRPGPPILSKGLVDRPLPPPPPLISRVRKLKYSAIFIKRGLKRKDSLRPFYSQFHTRRGENMVRRGGEKGRSGVSRKWNCMMQRPLFPGIRRMDLFYLPFPL